jgi:hypothetical protein
VLRSNAQLPSQRNTARSVHHRVTLRALVFVLGCEHGTDHEVGSRNDASTMDGGGAETADDADPMPDGESVAFDADDEPDGADEDVDGSEEMLDAAGHDSREAAASEDAWTDTQNDDGGQVVAGDAAAGPDGSRPDAGPASDPPPCGQLGALGVMTEPILSLGNGGTSKIARVDDRLLAADFTEWTLWDLAQRRIVAADTSPYIPASSSGYTLAPVLAGELLAVLTELTQVSGGAGDARIELRSARTGALLNTIATRMLLGGISCHLADSCTAARSGFGLATDGSYVWVRGPTSLSVWSAGAQPLAQASGDYSAAHIYAAPGQLGVALGPAGTNVIETLSTLNGNAATSPPFQGSFHSWFTDGAAFLTTTGTTVRVFTALAAQSAILSLPSVESLTGQGNHIWTYRTAQPDHPLDIYAWANPGSPAASHSLAAGAVVRPSGRRIAIMPQSEGSPLELIELDAPAVKSSIPLPTGVATRFASDATGWAVATTVGALYDGAAPTRSLSCGIVRMVAGSRSGTAAIVTGSNDVLLFDVAASPRRYLGSLPNGSGEAFLADDGDVLAAVGRRGPDRSLRVYALPSLSEVKVWPYALTYTPSTGGYAGFAFSMSARGSHFGHNVRTATPLYSSNTYARTVRTVGAEQPVLSLNYGFEPLVLSPSGARVAAATGANYSASTVANIYDAGVLVSAVDGYPLAWLDENRLLVNRFDANGRTLGGEIYDVGGTLQGSPPLPALGRVQVLSGDRIYSPELNTIYSTTTGAALWAGTEGAGGAIAADVVVQQASGKTIVVARP